LLASHITPELKQEARFVPRGLVPNRCMAGFRAYVPVAPLLSGIMSSFFFRQQLDVFVDTPRIVRGRHRKSEYKRRIPPPTHVEIETELITLTRHASIYFIVSLYPSAVFRPTIFTTSNHDDWR